MNGGVQGGLVVGEGGFADGEAAQILDGAAEPPKTLLPPAPAIAWLSVMRTWSRFRVAPNSMRMPPPKPVVGWPSPSTVWPSVMVSCRWSRSRCC